MSEASCGLRVIGTDSTRMYVALKTWEGPGNLLNMMIAEHPVVTSTVE